MNPDLDQRLDEHNRRRDEIIAKGKRNHGVDGVELERMQREKYHAVFMDVAGYASWLKGELELRSVECDKQKDEIEKQAAVISQLTEELEGLR